MQQKRRDLSLKQNEIKYNIYNNVYVYNCIIIVFTLLYTVWVTLYFRVS